MPVVAASGGLPGSNRNPLDELGIWSHPLGWLLNNFKSGTLGVRLVALERCLRCPSSMPIDKFGQQAGPFHQHSGMLHHTS